MAEKDKGFIDLGKEYDSGQVSADGESSSKKSVSYPTVHLTDVYELDDLPDGEFYFMAKGKVTRHTEEEPIDGERHCSCDISIMSIKPDADAMTESDESDDSDAEEMGEEAASKGLSKSLDKIAKKKMEDKSSY